MTGKHKVNQVVTTATPDQNADSLPGTVELLELENALDVTHLEREQCAARDLMGNLIKGLIDLSSEAAEQMSAESFTLSVATHHLRDDAVPLEQRISALHDALVSLRRRAETTDRKTFGKHIHIQVLTALLLGDMHRDLCRLDLACRYYASAFEDAAVLEGTAYQRDMWVAANRMGDMYRDDDQDVEALRYYETCRTLAKKNLRDVNTAPQAAEENVFNSRARDVGQSYFKLGKQHWKIGKGQLCLEREEHQQLALEYIEMSYLIAKDLWERNPDEYRLELATICIQFGQLHRTLNSGHQAAQYFQQAQSLAEDPHRQ